MNNDYSIIITEDDEGHARLIKKNLSNSGLNKEFLHFTNGIDLVNFLQNNINEIDNYDGFKYIILLDIRMPGMDGVEVLKIIKLNEILKKLPVIIITTTDDPEEIEQCRSFGCNMYINKPVDYKKFVLTINKLSTMLKDINNNVTTYFDFNRFNK